MKRIKFLVSLLSAATVLLSAFISGRAFQRRKDMNFCCDYCDGQLQYDED